MMPVDPPLLATYGTLMRDAGGPERLGVADRMAFVEPCRFRGQKRDLGSFPGVVPGDGVVEGDLYRLTDLDVLAVLDRYEGYNPDSPDTSLFHRRPTPLLHPPDTTAWVYWWKIGESEE